MAGANISGNLRNPQVAIPRGTLAAIAVSAVTYTLFALVSGATYARDADGSEVVLDKPQDCYLNTSCPYGLHNYYQAVCEDRLIPIITFFAKGYGPGNDPRRAYALCFLITVAVLMIDVNWGTSTTATTYKHAFNGVMKLTKNETHVKNYRPQSPIDASNQLATARRIEEMSQKVLRREHIKGICKVVVAPSLENGCTMLYQVCGLGRMSPNIVLLGFMESALRGGGDTALLKRAYSMSEESISSAGSEVEKVSSKKTVIDVWWLSDDGGLTLLVPYLLTQKGSRLKGASLRIFTVAPEGMSVPSEEKRMASLLEKFRIHYSYLHVVPAFTKPNQETNEKFYKSLKPFLGENEEGLTDPYRYFSTLPFPQKDVSSSLYMN
ncbi:hypothetical protein TELCIR_09040, partial [Teladorsagia circumcincta]